MRAAWSRSSSRARVRALLLAGSLALAGCGADLGAAGDPCTTSADCGPGLLCDTTQSPAVCAKMLSPHPDLAGQVSDDLSASADDLAGRDLAGADLAHPDLRMSD